MDQIELKWTEWDWSRLNKPNQSKWTKWDQSRPNKTEAD